MDSQIKVCCLVKKGDKVLLIKEWSENKNGYYWNLIKGTFERDIDRSLIGCVERETFEESNIKIAPTAFLGTTIKYGYSVRLYFGFICELSINKSNNQLSNLAQTEDEDIKEIKWFDIDNLKMMNEKDFVSDVSFSFLHRWINKEQYPLEVLEEINMTNQKPSSP